MILLEQKNTPSPYFENYNYPFSLCSIPNVGYITNEEIHRIDQIIPEQTECWNGFTLGTGSMWKEGFVIWPKNMVRIYASSLTSTSLYTVCCHILIRPSKNSCVYHQLRKPLKRTASYISVAILFDV